MNPNLYDISRVPVIVPVFVPAAPGQLAMVKNFKVQSNTPPWLEVIADGEGNKPPTFGVRGVHARAGVRLLEDCYADEERERDALIGKGDEKSLAAAERLQGMEGWKKYRRYLDDWAANRTASSFPVRLLPAKVREAIEGKADGALVRDPWSAEAESQRKDHESKEPARTRGK
jgi:hypothetical protein